MINAGTRAVNILCNNGRNYDQCWHSCCHISLATTVGAMINAVTRAVNTLCNNGQNYDQCWHSCCQYLMQQWSELWSMLALVLSISCATMVGTMIQFRWGCVPAFQALSASAAVYNVCQDIQHSVPAQLTHCVQMLVVLSASTADTACKCWLPSLLALLTLRANTGSTLCQHSLHAVCASYVCNKYRSWPFK